jgi:rhodanese-related sulfurtransferase
VGKKNRDLMALAPAGNTVMVDDGIMTVAGMQIDITDPSLAIQPQEAAKYLSNKQYLFIDIREPIEFSTRYIAGFTNMRVGDLVAGEEYKKLDKKKTIVLICEVGERGSAIAVFLRVRGYQALFIDKGIRGWQEKKLKVVGSDKMNLPDFRNKYKTVTVEEAKILVSEGKAVLVDVRSPGEFSNGHLTGAVNIPLVNMPAGELEKALNDLPRDKKIVGVAYDRFGVYYCMILGYLMNQKSIDYGGTLKYQPKNQTL